MIIKYYKMRPFIVFDFSMSCIGGFVLHLGGIFGNDLFQIIGVLIMIAAPGFAAHFARINGLRRYERVPDHDERQHYYSCSSYYKRDDYECDDRVCDNATYQISKFFLTPMIGFLAFLVTGYLVDINM